MTDSICSRCGRLLDKPTAVCWMCHKRPLPLQQIRTAVLFSGPLPTLIHQFKYNRMFGLAAPLGDLMVQAWPQWQYPTDIIVAIPLHPTREKERGYNQSELLAQHLRQALGVPHCPQVVSRIRQTQPQVSLNAAERLMNMESAFSADPQKVAGKKVLLIDDVCTTGATLSAAATALLTAGAETVSAYCLARAV